MADNIRVVARFRPLRSDEQRGGVCVDVLSETSVAVKAANAPGDGDRFTLDRMFFPGTQEEVFELAAAPIVDDVLDGYHGTVFAYGQTGSGKTHTMSGPDEQLDVTDAGVIPRAIARLFEGILDAPAGLEFTIQVSFVEIYMEQVRDLLDPSRCNLQIREHPATGVFVGGCVSEYVSGPHELEEAMETGNLNRVTGATGMNAGSSRSHSVFIIALEQKDDATGTSKTSRLYLVDLAGSEKTSKTGAEGHRLKEANTINKSLSALGNVIGALSSGKQEQHVPYRDSKLTRLLQDALGGNSKTAVIVCCSSGLAQMPETISSLRFGSRAKTIKNSARVNKAVTPEQLMIELAAARKIIEEQEAKIEALSTGDGSAEGSSGPASAEALARAVNAEMEVKRLEEENQNLLDDALDATALLDAADRALIDAMEDAETEKLKADEETRRMEAVALGAAMRRRAAQQGITVGQVDRAQASGDDEMVVLELEGLVAQLREQVASEKARADEAEATTQHLRLQLQSARVSPLLTGSDGFSPRSTRSRSNTEKVAGESTVMALMEFSPRSRGRATSQLPTMDNFEQENFGQSLDGPKLFLLEDDEFVGTHEEVLPVLKKQVSEGLFKALVDAEGKLEAAYVDDEISFKIKNDEADDTDPAAAGGGSKVVRALSYTAMHGSPEQVTDTQRQMQSLHQEAAEKNHTVALFPSLSWQDPALRAELHTEGDAPGADGEDVDKHEAEALEEAAAKKPASFLAAPSRSRLQLRKPVVIRRRDSTGGTPSALPRGKSRFGFKG